jgi:hypothetical protein
MTKEAAAHIKVNKLLEAVGWRFFADTSGPSNARLEPSSADDANGAAAPVASLATA